MDLRCNCTAADRVTFNSATNSANLTSGPILAGLQKTVVVVDFAIFAGKAFQTVALVAVNLHTAIIMKLLLL